MNKNANTRPSTRCRRSVVLTLFATACGSVQVPEQHYYRLQPGDTKIAAVAEVGVVRVDHLQIGGGLSADHLLVAGPTQVQLRSYGAHRWVAPLDRLVQDALRTGLARSGLFTDVKGPFEEGGEQLVLSGRILDFHQVAHGNRWHGKVTIELRGYSPQLGRPVFQGEFTAMVPLDDGDPRSVVLGLSRGLDQVVAKLCDRCRDWADSTEGKAVARPPAPPR